MQAETVKTELIDQMTPIFGHPPGDEPDKALAAYMRALGRFSGEALRETADTAIRTAKRRTWPMPGELIEIAKEAERQIRLREAPKGSAGTEISDEERERMFLEMLRSDVGKRAANEGWAADLQDFIREKGRVPVPSEADRLASDAAARDAKWRGRKDSLTGPLAGSLLACKGAMERREANVAALIRDA